MWSIQVCGISLRLSLLLLFIVFVDSVVVDTVIVALIVVDALFICKSIFIPEKEKAITQNEQKKSLCQSKDFISMIFSMIFRSQS